MEMEMGFVPQETAGAAAVGVKQKEMTMIQQQDVLLLLLWHQ